ncbi:MAG: right-handed parallel beta-helix repeat-containing protein [Planctomycetota bacterium]
MGPTLPIPLALLLLATAIAAPACGGGGSGGAGDGGEDDPGDNSTWVQDPPPVDPTPLPDADTAEPDHVVGDGTPAGLTAAALQAALDAGGVIVFDTGGEPATLALGAPLAVPAFGTVVIDGGNLVTLDGGGATAILRKGYRSELTVQNLAFAGARAAESGAAIDTEDWDGRLAIIDCSFTDCRTTAAGPDIGGGAVRALGQRHFQVSGSTFTDCAGSNGGALNSLGCQLTVIASSFTGCTAFGTGGGADQGPTGQGGIGGAIYVDGVDQNADAAVLRIDGCLFRANAANDHAGALFAYTRPGTFSDVLINACTFEGNAVVDPAAAGGTGGAIYTQNGDLMLTSSTFEGNEAVGNGGALWSWSSQVSRIADCTFHGNRAGALGGAMDLSRGIVYLSSLTIAGNDAGLFGGGIHTYPSPQVRIKNSILLANTATDPWNGHNVSRTLLDGDGNLQWPVKRSTGTLDDTPATATVLFVDPLLAAPADNGGPTRTLAQLPGSPARDGGTDTARAARDQRGYERVGAGDAGAFEGQ